MTRSATLSVTPGEPGLPTVLLNPEDQTVLVGGTASFTAWYTAPDGDVLVLWQRSATSGQSWVDLGEPASAGSSPAHLEIPGVTTAMDGHWYRARFQNAAGSVTTGPAVLRVVTTPPEITRQPLSQTVAVGDTATFTVEATGLDVQARWQWSADAGETWGDADTGWSFTTPVRQLQHDGYQYRAVLTNAGGTVVSEPATLRVTGPPEIVRHPEDQRVRAGSTATFTAAHADTGVETTVAWQVSQDGGQTWSVVAGAATASLAVPDVRPDMDGLLYRAGFTNVAGTTWSDAARLVLEPAPPTGLPTLRLRVTPRVVLVDALAGRG